VPSIPLTPDEEKRMLAAVGLSSLDDLFSTIPPKIREKAEFKLDLPDCPPTRSKGLSEHELRRYFGKQGARNHKWDTHFLGGGIYDNIVPAIVDQLALRGEFLTTYTPYQPEISQGTLQVIFEFQTLMSRITGMEVANASMYDGPTATAEAVLMAQRLIPGERKNYLLASALAPDTKDVVHTFLRHQPGAMHEVGWSRDGTLDLDQLAAAVQAHNPVALVVGYPNYFGVVEPLAKIRAALPKTTLLVASIADPSALSLFEAPGKCGADIVAGEGHQFGTPMLFGGPHLGFFATKKEFIRQMPGRLCGETVDAHGKRAYTLTLSTREQHIRREKATSNICTNQGLIALRATIYLSFLGKVGFQNLGEANYSLFDYLTKSLEGVGIRRKFSSGSHYREGVFEVPNLKHRFNKALAQGILPGIRLAGKFRWSGGNAPADDFANSMLICAHPKLTKSDIDRLVEVISHD
jgi:glycine dehydrogenase subunit 1